MVFLLGATKPNENPRPTHPYASKYHLQPWHLDTKLIIKLRQGTMLVASTTFRLGTPVD